MSWPSPEFLEIQPEPFNPHVLIQTSRTTPSSVAMAAAGGCDLKFINFPIGTGAANLPSVQRRVIRNFKSNNGKCALFGDITGFLFVWSPKNAIRLNIDGSETGRVTGRFWPQTICPQIDG